MNLTLSFKDEAEEEFLDRFFPRSLTQCALRPCHRGSAVFNSLHNNMVERNDTNGTISTLSDDDLAGVHAGGDCRERMLGRFCGALASRRVQHEEDRLRRDA